MRFQKRSRRFRAPIYFRLFFAIGFPVYSALWCKSNGSFLEGASHPEELVEEAHRLGLRALAITDRDGVYGIVRAHVKAKEARHRARRRRGGHDRRRHFIVNPDPARRRSRRLRQPLPARHERPAALRERRIVGEPGAKSAAHAGGVLALWGGDRSLLVARRRAARPRRGCCRTPSATGSTRSRRATGAPAKSAQEARLRAAGEARSASRSSPRSRCSITRPRGAPAGRAHLHPPRRHAARPPAAASAQRRARAAARRTPSRALFADDPAAVARTLEVAEPLHVLARPSCATAIPSERLPDGITSSAVAARS